MQRTSGHRAQATLGARGNAKPRAWRPSRWARSLLAMGGLTFALAGALLQAYRGAVLLGTTQVPLWLVVLRFAFVLPPLALFAILVFHLESVPEALRPGALLMTTGLALWMSYEFLRTWAGAPPSDALFEIVIAGIVVAGVVTHLYGVWREGRKMRRLAESDPLTGLGNRAGAQRAWNDLIPGTEAAVAIVDLNELKSANDLKGHAAGDELLRSCGTALSQACGDGGWVARWGGDEFLLVLPGVDKHDARLLLNTAEKCVTPSVTGLPAWAVGVVSVDAGVSLREAVQAADTRMYQEKAQQYRRAERATGRPGVRP